MPEQKLEEIKRKCAGCKKDLIIIGTDRKNGKLPYKDWRGRRFHSKKKCYDDYMADLREQENYAKFLKNLA